MAEEKNTSKKVEKADKSNDKKKKSKKNPFKCIFLQKRKIRRQEGRMGKAQGRS